jgi:hypothetical protein
VGEKWNMAIANQLLRAALAEIDELGDKLSPARAEALLDEFEHDISGALLRRDMSAVMAHCQTYARRFRSAKKNLTPGAAAAAASPLEG